MQDCGVSPQELIAETEILAALARGEEDSESVRKQKGKPIDLDAYFATPPDVRMAFSMLKGVELIPEELELLKRDQSARGADRSDRRCDSSRGAPPQNLGASRALRHADAELPAQGRNLSQRQFECPQSRTSSSPLVKFRSDKTCGSCAN